MIDASLILGVLKRNGFSSGSGVPCSILGPLLGEIADDPDIRYVAASNEAHASAIASGFEIGGRHAFVLMQNSGFCNVMEPLTSLNGIFGIPLLLFVSWRGEPSAGDVHHHGITGDILPDLLEVMRIDWAVLPAEPASAVDILQQAIDDVAGGRGTRAIVIRSGLLAPRGQADHAVPSRRAGAVSRFAETTPVTRFAMLETMEALRETGDVFLTTTGKSTRELFTISDDPDNLYLVGSMGLVSSVALGYGFTRPGRTFIIDGDGSLLMHMGALPTIGTYGGGNLWHVVLDNRQHDSTGGQATVSGNVDFAQVAASCAYGYAASLTDPHDLAAALAEGAAHEGPKLLHIRVLPGSISPLGRPSLSPADNLARFRKSADHESRQIKTEPLP